MHPRLINQLKQIRSCLELHFEEITSTNKLYQKTFNATKKKNDLYQDKNILYIKTGKTKDSWF